MPRINLLGQPYAAKSRIASGQEAINLYAQKNNAVDAPTPITYYQFPGTELFSTPINPGKCRCSYRTSQGAAYIVVGPTVYNLQSNGVAVFVGSIVDRPSQVYMADNGLVLVLVDGVDGWAIDLSSNAFGQIIDPSFYGADFVVFLDTFFVFNRPDTNQFYISLSMVDYAQLTGGTAFDPLDIAAKSGSADPIVGITTVHKELWLIGELTTEIWIGTGAADFYFQLVQGAYIDHGCAAQYSIASQDVISFWISQDKQGSAIIVQGSGYELKEISTPFIVDEIKNYTTLADAIGMCFQIQDEAFYLLVFPTANTTWLYALKTGFWSKLGKLNANGEFDRYRANSCMFAFGENLIGDYSTGKIYKLNPNVYTDDGDPIKWVRTFQHMVGPEYQRVTYKNLSANMEVGNSDQADQDTPDPVVFLSWSDDAGKSYGNAVAQSLGRQGQYLTDPQWSRLGMARDRIFKLEWSEPVKTALNGAFAEVVLHRS